ncbi:hypothetical protein [Porphyromonas gulae]|uniref:hypothetical protein n=1 Tax=Porphyromonas gulae TaxID=111105 RepID=UPI0026EB139D|nr:hypothetical protein [Porphyromonas gulae]
MNAAHDADIFDVLTHLERLFGDREKLSELTPNEAIEIFDRLSRINGMLIREASKQRKQTKHAVMATEITSEVKKQEESTSPACFDLRKLVTTLDFFRFRRELFQDDDKLIRDISGELGLLSSAKEAMAYLHQRMQWEAEDPTVNDFAEVVSDFFRKRG